MFRVACSQVRRPTWFPGQDHVSRGRWAQLSDIKYSTVNGVAVVSATPEIDIATAEQLQMALLEAVGHRHATVVVDMTRTLFCDAAALKVLAEAHQEALAEGGGLRLAIPVGGAVARLLLLTGLDCLIPSFGSLEGALASGRPHPSPGPRSLARQPGRGSVS